MTHIWVPKFKILEGELKVPKSRVEGLYTFTRRKADTMEVVQQVGPFKNLLTDAGLNLVGTTNLSYVAVGTGTNLPSISDTALQAEVARTNVTPDGIAYSPAIWGTKPYSSGSATFRFAAGAAAGNLSEVGFGWVTAGVFYAGSRARIVDSIGNPTTITVLSDEVLDVTYELRNYMYPWEDSNDDIDTILTLSGVNYDVTMRPLQVKAGEGLPCRIKAIQYAPTIQVCTGTGPGTPPALNTVTGNNLLTAGASGYLTSASVAYSNTSLTRASTHSAALNNHNYTYGIRGMLIMNYSYANPYESFSGNKWQATVTPAIPKDATKVLSFGSSYGWGRYTP